MDNPYVTKTFFYILIIYFVILLWKYGIYRKSELRIFFFFWHFHKVSQSISNFPFVEYLETWFFKRLGGQGKTYSFIRWKYKKARQCVNCKDNISYLQNCSAFAAVSIKNGWPKKERENSISIGFTHAHSSKGVR